jgi:hypothetical protein
MATAQPFVWFTDEHIEANTFYYDNTPLTIELLNVTDKSQIPETIERVSQAMASKETLEEQIDESKGLPCILNVAAGRYFLASNAARTLEVQLDGKNRTVKLISEEDLKALIQKRRGASKNE